MISTAAVAAAGSRFAQVCTRLFNCTCWVPPLLMVKAQLNAAVGLLAPSLFIICTTAPSRASPAGSVLTQAEAAVGSMANQLLATFVVA